MNWCNKKRDKIWRQLPFNVPKDMALRYDQWPTLFLHYLLDILMLCDKAHDGLPELLPKDMLTKPLQRLFLMTKDCLLVPRFVTRYERLARVKECHLMEYC